MTQDVLLAKLASIDRCLARIRLVAARDPDALASIDVQDIVVLNLQRAIQAAIDLAAHLISEHPWGLPDSLKAHFSILADHEVISRDLCKRLEAMAGFRNIAVHDYESLDLDILRRIVTERLGDLDEYADAVKLHTTARPR